MGVTTGLCDTHDLPHPFTLEINNFLMEAQCSFTRSNLFHSVLRDNVPASLGVVVSLANSHSSKVTQPRFGGDKKAREETKAGEGS